MVSDAKVVDIFIDSLCFFVRPREEIFKKKFFLNPWITKLAHIYC